MLPISQCLILGIASLCVTSSLYGTGILFIILCYVIAHFCMLEEDSRFAILWGMTVKYCLIDIVSELNELILFLALL